MLKEKLVQLAEYADRYNIHDSEIDVIAELSSPKDRIDVKIRPRINGKLSSLRVLGVLGCNPHSTGASPYKGGFRYHEEVTLERLEVFAIDMVIKEELANLPFGGAKFGIPIKPSDYSQESLRTITETMTVCLMKKGILHPDRYVPGTDVGTNSQIMYWIYNKAAEENETYKLPNIPAIVTGKPVENDGCPGREAATSRGLLYLLNRYRKLVGSQPEVTAVIQGFGNVGMNLAKLTLEEEFLSYKISAISDISGGIYNPKGLDMQDVIKHYRDNGSFKGYSLGKATPVTNEELLLLPCDILIPAAIENQITEKNAPKLQTKLVCEAGNATVTVAAQKGIEDRGITFICGESANVGGVSGSFLEWSLNRGPRKHIVDMPSVLEDVHSELKKIMESIIDRVYGRSVALGRTLAESAYVVALQGIQEKLIRKHSARKWK